ncbi:MAG: hypothetical protein A3H98_03300 [Bacteroidetes bacterium RIFCSPLOWO2_02_FULL_36_8]|nr:MAG: hypothetical protein A3H98_03300 [Bacteroidetes bacterium RIFCSPLOWO2_02_FULL_36_8]OFY71856.1 MAG: hypothetical protein A3G23_04845 [Bacteroidetes bacterium RIFCSPLOWO2_12_FULL_37_12]
MKNLKLILSAFFFSALLSGCVKESTACFTMDTPSAKQFSKIILDASCSENAEHYKWQVIGWNAYEAYDESKVNGAQVVQVYSFLHQGTYTIELKVTNDSEGEDKITKEVVIN